MKYFSSRRAIVRLVSFLCAALTVCMLSCPLAEVRLKRAEEAELDALMCGIDAITGAVCGIAQGKDTASQVSIADTALMLLPLKSDTADSLGRFLKAALNTPPESPDYALVADYAAALYGRLICISDSISSRASSSAEAAAMLPSLSLRLPLPEVSEIDGGDTDENFTMLKGSYDISEGEARDKAAEVIGSGIPLRLNQLNGTYPEVYSFGCANAYADITKYGGYLLRYSLAITPDAASLSTEEALQLLDRFVFAQGLGTIELCDVFEEGGFLRAIYHRRGLDPLDSPKIKAGIALDTGKVCYFDAYDFMKYS